MADGEDQEDKTQDASERRLQQAIDRGELAKSHELQGFLVVTAGAAAAYFTFQAVGSNLSDRLAALIAKSHVHALDMRLATEAASAVGLFVAGPFLALLIAGVAASLAMHPPVFTTEPLMPKMSRINPASGFKRLLSADNGMSFLRTLAKMLVALALFANFIWTHRFDVARFTGLDLKPVADATLSLTVSVTIHVLIFYAVIAVADAAYQKFAWRKRLRMTLHEVKEEQKETDGNPEVKSRLRALRQQRARRRIIAAVPKATVIIVNPTHYAVALKYEKGMPAPVCVAKGIDEVALKIREIARDHRIPIVENPPLARALHATVEVEDEIPADHYKAVAEVIGFILRSRNPRINGATR